MDIIQLNQEEIKKWAVEKTEEISLIDFKFNIGDKVKYK
jgi:hypothetical protein